MLQFLFDTDHLTLFDHTDLSVWQHFVQQPANSVGISAVTVEEYLRGRLASLARHQNGPLQVQAYSRLVESLLLFQQFPLVAFDTACESRYQQLQATSKNRQPGPSHRRNRARASDPSGNAKQARLCSNPGTSSRRLVGVTGTFAESLILTAPPAARCYPPASHAGADAVEHGAARGCSAASLSGNGCAGRS